MFASPARRVHLPDRMEVRSAGVDLDALLQRCDMHTVTAYLNTGPASVRSASGMYLAMNALHWLIAGSSFQRGSPARQGIACAANYGVAAAISTFAPEPCNATAFEAIVASLVSYDSILIILLSKSLPRTPRPPAGIRRSHRSDGGCRSSQPATPAVDTCRGCWCSGRLRCLMVCRWWT
jgi:hypothetical protein